MVELRLAAAERELDELRQAPGDRADLHAVRAQLEGNIARLRDENQDLSATLERALEAQQGAVEQVGALQTALERERAVLEAARNASEAARREAERSLTARTQSRAERDAARAAVDALRAELEMARQRVKDFESERQTALGAVRAAREEVRQARGRITQLEHTLEEAQAEADAARTQQLRDVSWFMQTLREIRGGEGVESLLAELRGRDAG
jgi:chromosome segregation ATPase